MRNIFLLSGILLLLFSCEVKVNTGKDAKGHPSFAKIRNGINLDQKGLKVTQAFLLYEDGSLVPEENTASIGQTVKLRLIIEGGWTDQAGKVMPGASERIETNQGNIVLDEKDLFGNLTEGITKEDAEFITISAVITRLDKLYDYFVVKFRVWDKNGPGEVTGNYKLYMK